MSAAEVLASVDIVALRLNPESKQLEVLLYRRDRAPHEGEWALPGVIVNGRTPDNTLAAAADRAMSEKARILPRHLEQVGTEGNAFRDPRGWSMSTYYLALLGPEVEAGTEQLCFVDVASVIGRKRVLPFDHNLLVQLACERLASKAVYTNLPLYLAPERFTVLDALNAVQACLGHPVNNTSLRKRLERMKDEGWIRDTGDKNFPKMGRPQQLFEHTPKAETPFVFDRSLLPERSGT
ncbi:NUDIX hydrolase [Pseudomonas sp. JV241A]|uniref:NUDIX hydrolase n=1 Tax=Pseudomonas sp. JV241A TaxID=2078785 RepID=UPI00100C868E|nr:NUDIX hydrolase [Pseudomonas sp. JV241A]SPO66153.1 NUDIX hydrolase [Pseudomonas sp. JV241A]